MFYRLSNRAALEELEEAFDATFEYPNVYWPEKVIAGLKESTITIITSERPTTIDHSIWGILPECFSDDWGVFQSYMNTLNIRNDSLGSGAWYAEAFAKRRCLILVTGFYSSFVVEGEPYPFFISDRSGKPFCLAGIYNRLEDGFFTTSLVTCRANRAMRQIHNLDDRMPVVLPENRRGRWLNTDLQEHEIRDMLKPPLCNGLRAIPVSKKMFGSKNSKVVHEGAAMPQNLKNLLYENQICGAKNQ